MLLGIGKEVTKQIQKGVSVKLNRSFLESLKKAILSMHEINTYINRFKKDSDYKASVRKLSDRITNMKTTKGLETDYGQLMFEGQVQFKMQNENRYNDKCYLICFQFRIMIFEIERHEEHHSTHKDFYFFMDSIEVSNKMTYTVEEKGKKEWIITVQTVDHNFVVINRKSFNIKVNLEQEKDELEAKFKDLLDKAAPRLCEKHRTHNYQTCLPDHDIDFRNPKPPPSSGECDLYLFGQIFMGYKCESCNCCYHEQCFITGSSDPDLGKPHL